MGLDNISILNNLILSFDKHKDTYDNLIKETNKNIATSKLELDKPFEYEEKINNLNMDVNKSKKITCKKTKNNTVCCKIAKMHIDFSQSEH